MGGRRRVVRRLAIVGVIAASAVPWVGASPPPAAAVTPATIVTIEWHDGNADQMGTRQILFDHGMHATFPANTGPILAADPAKRTVSQLQTRFDDGNEIGGHTLDHVNV